MSRNLVLVRFCCTDDPRLARVSWTNFPIAQDEHITAPVDLIVGEACKPDPESYQITQRHQPQILPNSVVMYHRSEENSSHANISYAVFCLKKKKSNLWMVSC